MQDKLLHRSSLVSFKIPNSPTLTEGGGKSTTMVVASFPNVPIPKRTLTSDAVTLHTNRQEGSTVSNKPTIGNQTVVFVCFDPNSTTCGVAARNKLQGWARKTRTRVKELSHQVSSTQLNVLHMQRDPSEHQVSRPDHDTRKGYQTEEPMSLT